MKTNPDITQPYLMPVVTLNYSEMPPSQIHDCTFTVVIPVPANAYFLEYLNVVVFAKFLAGLSKAFWKPTKLIYRLTCHSTLLNNVTQDADLFDCAAAFPIPDLLRSSSTAVISLSVRIFPSNLLAVSW